MKKYKIFCPLIGFQIPNVLIGPHEMTDEEVTKLFKERKKQVAEGIDLADEVKIRRISKEDTILNICLSMFSRHPNCSYFPFTLKDLFPFFLRHKVGTDERVLKEAQKETSKVSTFSNSLLINEHQK